VPLEPDGHVQRLRLKAADLPPGLSLVELRTDFVVVSYRDTTVKPRDYRVIRPLQEGHRP
jgi:hypothetical protein